MRRRPARFSLMLALFAAVPATAFASQDGHGLDATIWLILAGMILAAKIGGEVAVRLNQPSVLGELCVGIVLGNLGMIGVHMFDGAAELVPIEFLAELGVVLLLFEVGLESTLTEMRAVAPTSGMVAIIGVVAPMALGYGVSLWLLPDAPFSLHLFIGATLCATSVGITARVLKDLNAMAQPETRVILGAAVIDDVLGLIVLAVVASIAEFGAMPGTMDLTRIIGLAAGFLVGALVLGAYVMPGVFRAASKLRTQDVLAAVAIGLCLLLAGVSGEAGLAPIVGAFAAGLILDEVHVRPFGKTSAHDLTEIIGPIVAVVAPIFFVRTGMMVQLSGIGTEPLFLAFALTVVAIIGKLVAGLGVRGKTADRLTVGIGMVPRGEVGLIFANVGAGIRLEGKPLIAAGVYAAIVLMVMASTVVTPPWLAQRLRQVMLTRSDDA
ncbi:MAG: cation:proton antiporter [Myxococcales bacterium]|nr:cation:proton antiporter [Myxococcales bacterium]MDH3483828.1 cation:proton antiporter [Myxococcales bacterium]